MTWRPTAWRTASMLVLMLAALAGGGCNVLGWTAAGVAGEDSLNTVKVKAEYLGLTGKSVAVMVSADDRALFLYPNAPLRVSRQVTTRLKVDVTDLQPMDPQQVIAYQDKHPDWVAIPYGEVIRDLKVQRIVHIALSQYTTHEPGNRHVWRGVIEARVGVVEADAADPDNFVYARVVKAVFPEDRPIGVLKANDEVIQKGMLDVFARRVAQLFRDHEVTER